MNNKAASTKYGNYQLVRLMRRSDCKTLYGIIYDTRNNTIKVRFSSLRQIQKAKRVMELIVKNSSEKSNVVDRLDDQFFNLLSLVFAEERHLNINLLRLEMERMVSK
jgi:hypothetical protein